MQATESIDYNPPKLSSNSIWLFHTSKNMSYFRMIRFLELPAIMYMLIFTINPVVSIMISFALYQLSIKALLWENPNRSVVRLDYLPDIDKISVTKVGPFGFLYNRLWDKQCFKKLDPHTLIPKGNFKRTGVLEIKP